MGKPLTTAVAKLASLFHIIEENGMSRRKFLTCNGMDPAILDSPDNRLTLEQVHLLTQQAALITGDDSLGLHQGERFMGFSNILGYVMLNCRNMGHALSKLNKYQKICDEATDIALRIENDAAVVKVGIRDHRFETDRHLTDYRLCGTYTYLKKLTGVPFRIREARLRHPAPLQRREYERAFQSPVVFDHPENAIVFDRRCLDLPIPDHNSDLLKILEAHAQKALKILESRDLYSHRVGKIIWSMMQGQAPSVENVASELSMSARNLQLKLKNENTTFSRILNDIRKELAMSYLDDDHFSITEIAYLLGYSEVSVFYRAFKKWTDLTPVEFRCSSNARKQSA